MLRAGKLRHSILWVETAQGFSPGHLQLCRRGGIPSHSLNKEPPSPGVIRSLNRHFLAFKRSGSRPELVRAQTLSLSNLPSLEDAKGAGQGDFGLPPAGTANSAQCWNFCIYEMKMQANKIPIRGGREWMDESPSLRDLLLPLMNEFHLPH